MSMYEKRGPARYSTVGSKINPNAVVAAWSAPQFFDGKGNCVHGEIDSDHPDVLAYINRLGPIAQKLAGAGLTVHDISAAFHLAGMFVERDKDGRIIGAFLVPKHEEQDLLPSDSPELREFLGRRPLDGRAA